MKKVCTSIIVLLFFCVLVSEELNLSSGTQNDAASFFVVHEEWLSHWKNQNIEEYLKYYHQDFMSVTSNMNLERWTTHKRLVFNPRRTVEVEFSDIQLTFEGDRIQFIAYQDYRARNFSDFGRKTMFWVYENNRWLILKEDWVETPRPVQPPDPPIIIDPPDIIEPPIIIEPPKPDTLRPIWEARVGQVPFEYINFLFDKKHDYDDYLFVVEKRDQYAALYRFEDGFESINLLNTYIISSGQVQGNKMRRGDLKTPEGLYFTIQYIPERQLEARFGSGAFVLDYPNELDRVRRKTGSGIWIHGSDIDMVPFDTEGCVRFENEEITYFREVLNIQRAPVIINDIIEWTNVNSLRNEIEKINKILADWEESWETQDIERYLAFYCSNEFITHRQRMDYHRWVTHKRAVFNPRNNVVINLSNFDYYYADHLLLVTFYQDYKSNSLSSFGRKQLVLRRLPDSWIIIQEEWVPARRPRN
jgi:murein L,D-transpeptidase YafK